MERLAAAAAAHDASLPRHAVLLLSQLERRKFCIREPV